MSSIVFYNRDFTGTISLDADIDIERYSFHMLGGPDTATLRVHFLAEKWEMTKLLRCPVEIYGADGGIKWWGYVNRVTIPHRKIRVGLGLDELFNSVSIKYSGGTTSANVDTQSTTEYGTKEFLINLGNAGQTDAENYRNTYSANHKYAVPEIDLSGNEDEIIVECYGWWKTLEWKYYSNASETAVENTTQISAIITACGQFIAGTIIETTSGLTTVPTRDGTNTGLAYITELLSAGTSNARPLLAYVDKNRYIHVYERIAETTEYIMRDDGQLETLLGKLVEPESCIHAAWVRVKGVPDTLGGISAMRPFFIERAEYIERDQGSYENF